MGKKLEPNQSKPKPPREGQGRGLSIISKTFLEHNSFLQKFLARFLSQRQDIEDVVQETYLRAFRAEQGKTEQGKVIEHPKAFLFQIAKNVALTQLSKKSRQITDYIKESSTTTVRYLDNGQKKVERGFLISQNCTHLIFESLRGDIKSMPKISFKEGLDCQY